MKHLLLAALAAAAPVTAQQLATTFAGGTTVPSGGTVFFNLDCNHPNGITVSSFVLNFADPGGTAGTVDIYVADPGTPFDTTWTPLVTGINVTAAGPGAPTNVPLGVSSPLQLSNGCDYNVAIVSSLQHLVTPDSTTGQSLYSNADLSMQNGVWMPAAFAGVATYGHVTNGVIFYQSGGTCPSVASTTNVGQGCVQRFDTVYELFSPGSLDLTSMTFNGRLQTGGTTNVAPSGFSLAYQPANPGTAVHSAVLTLPDDGQATLGTYGFQPPFDTIAVGSNGWVALGPGNSNYHTPSATPAANNPSSAYYAWKDLDPSSGGTVWVEQRLLFGVQPQLLVTYEGVPSYGEADANTFQFVLTYSPAPTDTSPFTVTAHFVSISPLGTNLLVGAAKGGPSQYTPYVDLSQAHSYSAQDVEPLQLNALTTPRQGSAPIPFEMVTSNIPATGLLHIGIFGFAPGAVPLDTFGMPTCSLYQSLDFLLGPQLVTGSSLQWTAWTAPPVQPSYAGVQFHVQSIVMGTDLNDAFGGLGVLTSNGVTCTIGTL